MIAGRRRQESAPCSPPLTAGIAFPTGAVADETAEQAAPKVELVLDVSGSMRARDIDGGSRMSAAKQAFDGVLDATPEEVQLGIRTLGANYRGNNHKTGCKDTAQLYPVGTLNRTEAKTAVATLTPTAGRRSVPRCSRRPATSTAATAPGGSCSSVTARTPASPSTRARWLARSPPRASGSPSTPSGSCPTPRPATSSAASRTRRGARTPGPAQGRTHRPCRSVGKARSRPGGDAGRRGGRHRLHDCPDAEVRLYTDREEFGQHRYYRVDVKPGQELRASVSVAADREVNPDYGVLLRAVTVHGTTWCGARAAGTVVPTSSRPGLRYPKAKSDDVRPRRDRGVLQASNSFSAASGVKTTPGMPVELTVDVVDGPDQASDVASFGLGRGWRLLGALVLTGFLAGVLWAGSRACGSRSAGPTDACQKSVEHRPAAARDRRGARRGRLLALREPLGRQRRADPGRHVVPYGNRDQAGPAGHRQRVHGRRHLYWSFPADSGQRPTVKATVKLPEASTRHAGQTWQLDVYDGLRRRQACQYGAQTRTAAQDAASVELACTLRTVRSCRRPGPTTRRAPTTSG